jgi:flagellar L-ring protein precursor FlgH
MKNFLFPLSTVLLLLLVGCSAHQVPANTAHQPTPAPVAPPLAPTTAGSLWTEGQGSLFYDHKARNVGDIVTVAIYEKASASKEASTATGRDSNASADISKFFGLESNLGKINSTIDPTNLVEVRPTGNLRIAGSKTVTVNNEDQIIRLAGIIRQADISPANIVDSQHILDADIEYTGNGVISDKQKPGWMVRILDNVWPF